MKIRWLLQACIVVAVGMGLVSCTKAEIEQAMNRPAEIMLQSSPCQPAGIASTATPEFCINVTEIQLTSHDTQADVSLTLINRTGRRHFIYVSGLPSMIDSSGTKWIGRQHTGLGNGTHYPVAVEPNVETQGSITFYQNGQVATDLTFSLRGEIAIMQVDSRGQPIPFKTTVTRGFNISGIRLPPAQSSAPAEQNPVSKLAQVSPPQSVASATPKPPASSQSTAPAAIAGASGIGNPSSQKPASPDTSSTSGQMAKAIDTPADDVPIHNSGLKSVGGGNSGPNVTSLRIGMTPDQTRAILKSQVLTSDSLRKSYKEIRQSLMITLPSGVSGGPVQNGTYLSQIVTAGTQDDIPSLAFYVAFSPIPGQEGIVSISRSTTFPDSKKPTFDAFEKSLLEKYGTPHIVNNNARGYFWYWSYDSNGTLKSPGFLKDYHPCTSADRYISPMGQLYIAPPFIPAIEQLPAQCGDIFLRASMSFDGTYHGRETMVRGYGIAMMGYDAAIRAAKVAGALIDKASADASAAAIKKGQQQKPAF